MVADSHGEGAYTKKTAQKHKEYHHSCNRKEKESEEVGRPGWGRAERWLYDRRPRSSKEVTEDLEDGGRSQVSET